MKPTGGAVIASHTFTTAAVRDLAWACFSPALICCDRLPASTHPVVNCGLTLTPERRRWLEDLDREPARLHRYLSANTNHRLGIYFERLWHFFLNEDSAAEVVAVNLPVREAGRTLGEFDVIYFCRVRQCHVHLELAVKFFMGLPSAGLPSAGLPSAGLPSAGLPSAGSPNPAAPAIVGGAAYSGAAISGAAYSGAAISGADYSNWNQWLGPNTRDRLDLKLKHMLGRQIRLSEQAAATELLRSLGVAELTRELEMKGYLFQALNRPLSAPLAYNPKRSLSTWLSVAQLNRDPELLHASRFLPLQRLQWLAPVASSSDQSGLSPSQLLQYVHQHFISSEDALLVAQLDSRGAEINRLFIAPEQWPTPANISESDC